MYEHPDAKEFFWFSSSGGRSRGTAQSFSGTVGFTTKGQRTRTAVRYTPKGGLKVSPPDPNTPIYFFTAGPKP